MKMQNAISGDILEVPMPNVHGESCVILNGVEILQVLYSDAKGGIIYLGDGRRFSAGEEFADFLVSLIAPKRAVGSNAEVPA